MPLKRKRRDQGNKKKKKKKQNDMLFRHWNKLPNDLLRVIMEKLTRVDRIRIRAVCKDWLIPMNGIPHHPFDKLPWMMTYSWKRTNEDQLHSVCELFDPFQRCSYIAEKTLKPLQNSEERWQFVGAKARASRNGWVLFSNNKQDFFPVNGMLVFAFCPFTDEVVQLPEFEGDFERAAFSTTPTLPDCVFFLVSSYKKKLEISTCHPGDKTWTRFVYKYKRNLSLELLDMNYADGNFYCVFVRGIVGAFNIMLQEWNLLSNVEQEDSVFNSFKNAKIVANREELLLLGYDYILWRFDLMQREWETEWEWGKKLENRTVFLGTTSFVIPAVGMLSEFSPKAYYFGEYRQKMGHIHCCHTLRGFPFHDGHMIDQTRLGMGIIWIELPPALCSS